ncbi:hypothetical protein [Legionella tucsonensis]|uniref:Uncharacterized protein n=1 Tax=Legionella tucsonensis TaxID=40335 RepID=A0A0W0ZZ37_9GAMM|nr:hypothetical protein [Legionella tucsonensis]KTD74375.1 hypothetical protein Ltuc_2222 [Legionella tucsonensis]
MSYPILKNKGAFVDVHFLHYLREAVKEFENRKNETEPREHYLGNIEEHLL